MKESQFIQQNHADWEALEQLLKQPRKDADELQRLFVKTSSDLSYARSFFPRRSVTLYLNNLTQEVFDSIRSQEEKFSFKVIVDFFRRTLPYEIYRSRNAFIVSFLVFTTAVIIGAVSSAHNEDFLAVVVGDSYVEMTEDNINEGDPMAVYKDTDSNEMFFGITMNNIRVAFFAFVSGLAAIFGTILILITNGIMLGAFQYFFYAKGLFMTSFLTIWIHGTIEISAIIIAGAAGIVLGHGLLFPGTYSRAVSLQIAAQRGIRIILGTVPLFIIAGFLESFVTRLTEMPSILKVAIIGGSLLLIIGQWVIFPILQYRRGFYLDPELVIEPSHFLKPEKQDRDFGNLAEIVAAAMAQFRDNLGKLTKFVVLPGVLFFSVVHYFCIRFNIDRFKDIEYAENVEATFSIHSFSDGGFPMFLIMIFFYTFMLLVIRMIFSNGETTWRNLALEAKHYGGPILIAVTLLLLAQFVSTGAFVTLILVIVLPVHLLAVIFELTQKGSHPIKELWKSYARAMQTWLTYFPLYLLIGLFLSIFAFGLVSGLSGLIVQYFTWHQIFELQRANSFFFQQFFLYLLYMFLVPLFYLMLVNRANANERIMTASDLRSRMDSFGQDGKVFESPKVLKGI